MPNGRQIDSNSKVLLRLCLKKQFNLEKHFTVGLTLFALSGNTVFEDISLGRVKSFAVLIACKWQIAESYDKEKQV